VGGGRGGERLAGGRGGALCGAGQGTTIVTDDAPSQGDQLAFNSDPGFAAAFARFESGQTPNSAYAFETQGSDLHISAVTGESLVVQDYAAWL